MALVAETEIGQVPYASTPQWQTLNFTTPPLLTASTDYILAAWADTGWYGVYIAADTDINYNGYALDQTFYGYGEFPDPLGTDAVQMQYSIYCTLGTNPDTIVNTIASIYAEDSSDPYLREWVIFTSAPTYLGGGQWTPTPIAYTEKYSGDNWYVELPNGTYYFAIGQSGGSNYGTYSGHITVNGITQNFSGVDVNNPFQFNATGTTNTTDHVAAFHAQDASDPYAREWVVFTSAPTYLGGGQWTPTPISYTVRVSGGYCDAVLSPGTYYSQ